MAFVRRKRSRGREAYYLVENRRENGHVRQRVVAYLGSCATVDEAIVFWSEDAERRRKYAATKVERWPEMARRQNAWAEKAERRVEFLRQWRSARQCVRTSRMSGTTVETSGACVAGSLSSMALQPPCEAGQFRVNEQQQPQTGDSRRVESVA